MRVDGDAQYLRLRQIWRTLGRSEFGTAVRWESERAVDRAVGDAAGLPEWNGADAAMYRALLVNIGAISVERTATGLRFRRADDFPAYAPPGSDAFNAELAARTREERERRERIDRQLADDFQKINAPVLEAERARLRAVVDERLAELGLIPAGERKSGVSEVSGAVMPPVPERAYEQGFVIA